ncbi:related to cell cycle arrest protein BUB2 [Melanopsichium pennsylvanicum]|uniref:Related to cell cycle arrest protein BUB2 n=2 Tax=Melanopsichium pennsylvanicum TaxID=63383 RepID=A0AAJ4XG61_9BASI|nr:related to cell cycle arrest protein BUB2 [Melanopsichium pennsylvanicum 4]SNX81894.1 related to cell cycle arrest protein BUB2 [Melanopsichium pennsylvanicum]
MTEVSTPSSSSGAPRIVDSFSSRNTSSSDDAASISATEWKRLFIQMQSHQTLATSSSSARKATRTSTMDTISSHRSSRGRGGTPRAITSSTRGSGRTPASRRLLDSPSTSTSSLPTSPSDPLSRIRHKLITTPLPPDSFLTPTNTSYRSVIWKLLLNIDSLDIPTYLSLVAKGNSPSHEKIRNDTFRTLATDQGFKERVKEEKLIRLLDAFVWKYNRGEDSEDEADDGGVYEFSYVQGMNVLAAPFLYTMESEVEAFRCFSRFIEWCCPLYVQPTLGGVHRGLQLLDRCLEILDPPLYTHLRSKNLSAEIYAFPSVMTMCACTPPLPEVLQLWDFLLAFGVHFNVLCIVAQLHIMRTDLLESNSPMKLLRNLPRLDARKIIKVTVTLARDVPEILFEELVKHPYHPDSVIGFI